MVPIGYGNLSNLGYTPSFLSPETKVRTKSILLLKLRSDLDEARASTSAFEVVLQVLFHMHNFN